MDQENFGITFIETTQLCGVGPLHNTKYITLVLPQQFYKSLLPLPHRSTTWLSWSRLTHPGFLPIHCTVSEKQLQKDSESTQKGNSLLACLIHSWKHVRVKYILSGHISLLKRLKNSNFLVIPHTPLTDTLPICPHPLILLFSLTVNHAHHQPMYSECLIEAQ